MDYKFMPYIVKLTFFLALCVSLIASFYQNVFNGAAILLGAFWGLANLYCLKMCLQELLKLQSRDNLRFYTLLFIKFPLLYLSGYGLLRIDLFPTLNLLVGFSLIFIAIFLFGLGKMIMTARSDTLC